MLVTANIFQPLIDVFEAVLKFFHNSIGVPWGWSIVLLTVVIRLVLVPLTVKQFRSMQQLQRHQPEMKAIQAKYKDDKTRQQEEMMKFYKENNVNPLGSCLPMAAQLPVFISLFYMLRATLRADVCPAVQPHHLVKGLEVINHAVTVACGPHNGAAFLFISDLTTNAKGLTLVVLIALYVGTQFASTLLMSMSTPTMDKTQRQIMLVMPLLFVLFVLDFPAGVIVYWITTNTWTMIQQYVLRRRLGVKPPVGDALVTVGGSSGGGALPTNGAGGNGGGPGGGVLGSGFGNLLRGRSKDADGVGLTSASSATTRPAAVPPRPPRKKKKRSGRRR
jgi:YidC/Oxa1 family membrane protein insertase